MTTHLQCNLTETPAVSQKDKRVDWLFKVSVVRLAGDYTKQVRGIRPQKHTNTPLGTESKR